MASDLQLFAQGQMEAHLERERLRPYPSLKAIDGKVFLVISNPDNAWANAVIIDEFDMTGIAQILNGGATDGGKIEIFATHAQYNVRTYSAYTEIPYTVLEQAKRIGTDINSKYAQALIWGHKRRLNDIAYNGDPVNGLQGVFTSQIQRITAATTFASAATPDALMNIITNAIAIVVNNSNGLWKPKKIVLPERQHQLIATTYRVGTNQTILEAILSAQAVINGGQVEEFIADNMLIGRGDNGSDAMLILPDGVDSFDLQKTEDGYTLSGEEQNLPIYFSLPLDTTVPEDFKQLIDTYYRERGICRTGGLVVTDPLSAAIVSGI